MSKFLGVLVIASMVALAFPSAFERYRASLVAQGEAERLDPPPSVIEAALPAPYAPGGRTLRLPAGPDGHFRTEARFDGRREPVLVDTGATYVALGEAAARRLGIRVARADFVHRAQTAQGEVPVALARVARLSLGLVEARDVEIMVIQGTGPATTLLGMSFLKRLTRFSVEDGRLTLVQ